MTPLMIALVIAAAVGALVYVVASSSIEKADVRESLRRLEGYQIQDVRDQEMLAPMSERVVAPLLEGLTGVAHPLHARRDTARRSRRSWCTPATRRTSTSTRSW